MNKKGFTLIELLAVIIILAIIALIAVPIVLDIIDDSKKSTTLMKAEFYLDAVDIAIKNSRLEGKKILDNEYKILSNGNLCLSYEDDECKEVLEVGVKGETPKEGTIKILNEEIDEALFTIDNKEITKNSKGEIVYIKTLEEVCELKEGTAKTAGAKYECKVDPNKDPYTFYVLTTPKTEDKSINLIMNANINASGEAVIPGETSDTGLVAWINQDDHLSVGGKLEDWDNYENLNIFGPITAMKFLNEATKNWTNTNEIKTSTVAYENGNTYTMSKTYYTNARMPIFLAEMNEDYDIISEKGEVGNKKDDNSNAYLYTNLDSEGSYAPVGYWTLSPVVEDSGFAWLVDCGGLNFDGVGIADFFGLRPVINLKI